MHDIKSIRDNPEAFDAGLRRRGLEPLSATLLGLDRKRRAAIGESEQVQAKRKALSKQIGIAKGKGENADALLAEASGLDGALKAGEAAVAAADAEIRAVLAALPNLPADDVPDGADESGNVELRKVGAPRSFNFPPKDHVEIGEGLGMMDFATAAKISGARFVMLKGPLARLERALAQFMLDLHTTEHGYTEINPPLLVKDSALFGTGQLPKFEDDQFKATFKSPEQPIRALRENRDEAFTSPLKAELLTRLDPSFFVVNPSASEVHNKIIEIAEGSSASVSLSVMNVLQTEYDQLETRWLIPTAEVPLTNVVADEIVDAASLPRRMTAWTPCFRSEAGAAGRDTRGMIRQHQFPKVEMVSIAAPEESDAEHRRMTKAAEKVLKRLGLPYRTIVLCSGDMGFSARKTFDIEVWLPGQHAYREISSCSNCGDFQARRMNARFRKAGEKGTQFVHTLNGSGVAVGRCLVAILENYQEQDGSVVVPEALRPYMGGLTVIERPGK